MSIVCTLAHRHIHQDMIDNSDCQKCSISQQVLVSEDHDILRIVDIDTPLPTLYKISESLEINCEYAAVRAPPNKAVI